MSNDLKKGITNIDNNLKCSYNEIKDIYGYLIIASHQYM